MKKNIIGRFIGVYDKSWNCLTFYNDFKYCTEMISSLILIVMIKRNVIFVQYSKSFKCRELFVRDVDICPNLFLKIICT